MPLQPGGSGWRGGRRTRKAPEGRGLSTLHRGRPPQGSWAPAAEHPPEWGSAGAGRPHPQEAAQSPQSRERGGHAAPALALPGPGACSLRSLPCSWASPDTRPEGEGGEGAGHHGPGAPPGADEPSVGRDSRCVICCGICCETYPPPPTMQWSKEPERHTRGAPRPPTPDTGVTGVGGLGDKAASSRAALPGCRSEP